jgi:ABC-type lipoprotein release transport system permease subunit
MILWAPLNRLWIMAYRDLERNRRRSLLTLMAVALGLALLLALNGYIAGTIEDSIQNSVRLRTGHVQVRASSYEEAKLSLLRQDMLLNPDGWAARARAMGEVKAAAPVVWAGGILETSDDAASLQVYGIDPASPIYEPIRAAIVAGEFLSADDRGGILIGKRLADSLGTGPGRKANLAIVDADDRVNEGAFAIRGLFSTGVPSYDESAVLMPLSTAQAFARVDDQASAIVILLNDQADADRVAAALGSPGVTVLTWSDMNQVLTQTVQASMGFYLLVDAIVMLIVAVIIANTLLMSVFERIREVGILAALGMKGRQIMQLFLVEAAILGGAGIVAGLALGLAGVAYLTRVGIYIGDLGAVAGSSVALGTSVHARFVPGTFAALSLATWVMILLASLYPAWYAARLEPVEALRGQ